MPQHDFTKASHTIVVSDIHLADAEKPHPGNPLWKRFKRPKHFIDKEFKALLEYLQGQVKTPIELVLNGDIFDFDSVMTIPEDRGFRISWIERMRGLASEEEKSVFKIGIILDTHPLWLDAIRDFLIAGNSVIFVIGNHDMELHWPAVRAEILARLSAGAPNYPDLKDQVRFCEWFYLSNKDTLIEHGNQYDAYCLCSNPVHPLIRKGSRVLVRLPFGNLAGKYMINGMGLMNPHNTSSFIKATFAEYIVFFYKNVMRTQPFLLWTWFWSAMVTMYYSLTEGFLPAMRDPLTVDARIEDIALRANTTVSAVLALKEVHVHPAIFDPIKILRELWLDRAILLVLIIFGSFQFFGFLNVFATVSVWWFFVPTVIFLPLFIFYARSVQSEVDTSQQAAFHLAPLSARITKVKRIVQGHTHLENHSAVEGVEVLNTGTWSPAYHDVECTQPYGRKCFAWILPETQSGSSASQGSTSAEQRIARLFEWKENSAILIPGP
ncbi:MAG: metallophosphoesterase [Bdellovibrio sp.]|nr:metallophosphoesterase [Bdellovibrio sp.]